MARFDCIGLVPLLGLDPGRELRALDDEQATLETRGKFAAFRLGDCEAQRFAVPVWGLVSGQCSSTMP